MHITIELNNDTEKCVDMWMRENERSLTVFKHLSELREEKRIVQKFGTSGYAWFSSIKFEISLLLKLSWWKYK